MISCVECNESFVSKRQFVIHNGKVHNGPTCYDCKKAFSTETSLKTHRYKFHKEQTGKPPGTRQHLVQPFNEEETKVKTKDDASRSWLDHAELFRYLFRGVLEGDFKLHPSHIKRLRQADQFLREVAYSKSYKTILMREAEECKNLSWIVEIIVAYIDNTTCMVK